ncbi:MAG TPA: Crp/Fnr family transcriptional regulator [Blastocatellia bacterium]|nr:Crp/Fnr family transcriptional regulator [Blastocatellia bacterium]
MIIERTHTLTSTPGPFTGCSECHLRYGRFFCDLPEGTLRAFDDIVRASFYPQGTLLFIEGQAPRGVFILCGGRAKLTISSSNGKTLMRIAEPGETLGLSATISNAPYEGSAEMLEAGQVNFVRRDDFLRFLREHGEAGLRAAQHLSRDYYAVYDQVRSLALSDSVGEKLARLLLGWCARNGRETDQGIHLRMLLTHGEIAQMIGASRETVTRLFGELKNRQIIQCKGSSMFICDKAALESLVSS